MYRLGHTGIALLVLAPLSFVLLEAHKPLLAFVIVLGVLGVEPLPDLDFRLPVLTHRGVSHSLLAAIIIGGLLGLCGWVATGQVAPVFASLFATASEAVMSGATTLHSVTSSGATGRIADLFRALADSLRQIGTQLRGLDRQTVAGYSFGIGAGGILVHLLGDVITVSGIRPFLPFSSWRLSVSSLRAKNGLANTGLFAGGVVAIAVVLSLTVGGASVAGMSADLSPIGAAHAQDPSPSMHTGSVQITATASNRTQIELESVTLPQNGFIVARSGNLSANTSAQGTVLGHTQYVRHGNFSDVILNLSQPANTSQTVSVTLHNDTNGNRAWNGARTDAAYNTSNETPVFDTVRLGSSQKNVSENRETSTANATVELANQTTNDSTVTIRRATLPQPGYVAIHTSSYANGLVGPNESMIAVSQHLSAGTHHNTTVNISHAPPGNAPGLNRSQLNETETVVATVYGDTNGNEQLDSVRSFGENDTIITENGSVVRDTARVRVPTPPRQTASVVFQNQTLQNNTLTVAHARLPRGGFLIAHNASYRRTGDAVMSTVAISRYLPPGTYTNVILSVVQGALDKSQTVTIRPSLDTNGNQQYDFVTSDGFQDVAYETLNRSDVITDAAQVRVSTAGQEHTPTTTRSPTTRSSTTVPATPAAGSELGGVGSGIWIVGIGILGVVGGTIFVFRRVR